MSESSYYADGVPVTQDVAAAMIRTHAEAEYIPQGFDTAAEFAAFIDCDLNTEGYVDLRGVALEVVA